MESLNELGTFVREFGSFGLIIMIFWYGIKYIPRTMLAMEKISDAVERIETRIEKGR